MYILGIETSCDETSCAIVDNNKTIISHIIHSQIEEHQPYGGVVPELASRAHISHLDKIIKHVMLEANLSFRELDGIAVTGGPGLIGGLLVGVMMAKAIASVVKKPFIAVNHLEAHALTVRLTDNVEFPYLLLLISGGHCQILIVKGVGHYLQLGSTIDDAVGEAFDKVAKMLQLNYPGGPEIEKLAIKGDEQKFKFPLSFVGRKNCDFSFSGLKTAVRREIDKHSLTPDFKADISAAFQRTVSEILIDRLKFACNIFKEQFPNNNNIVVAGGVAANNYIKQKLKKSFAQDGFNLIVPQASLCTDNGAMVAWCGMEYLLLNKTSELDFAPRARWAL